jgi:hypothetical protein
MLSAVAKRRDKRLLSEGWEHEPTHEDSRAFPGRLHTALPARDLPLVGSTTAGAALSPAPLREVCGAVPHPIWTLHGVAAVGKAVWGAVARARKGLAAQQPQLRRGRPSPPAATQAARTKKRLAAHRTAVCASRSRCVQRPLHTTARQPLWRVSRGLPQFHTRRAILDQG